MEKKQPIIIEDNDPGEISDELLYVSKSGVMKKGKPMCTWRPHGRVDWQIIYISDGSGYFQFGETIEKIGPSALVVYKPLASQKYMYFLNDYPCANFVHFSGTIVEDLMTKLGLIDMDYYYIDPIYSSKIEDIFLRFHSEVKLNEKRECYIWASLIYLLSELSHYVEISRDSNGSDISEKNSNYLLPVIEEMHKNGKLNHTISYYSKLVNMSQSHFAHCFKKKFGVSPIQYQKCIILNKAKDLLNTSMSINEISLELGYNDVSIFSKAFKKATGLSPLNYRKKFSKNDSVQV